MTSAMLDKVDYDLAHKMYRERYTNGDRFTFTFVGNINPNDKDVQKLIEKYLGALPKANEKETFRDVKNYPVKGEISNVFDRQMETPKTTAFAYYSGTIDYTLKNRLLMDILYQSLSIVYIEKVREDEGGTYGVYVRGNLDKLPYPSFNLQIIFDTNPDIIQKLMGIIYGEIDSVVENGVREADFLKVTEFMQKKIKESKAENGYWLGTLEELAMTSTDLATDYETTLNAITMEDVKNFAAGIFNQKNRVEVIMNPHLPQESVSKERK
jgi:zinc protease